MVVDVDIDVVCSLLGRRKVTFIFMFISTSISTFVPATRAEHMYGVVTRFTLHVRILSALQPMKP